MQAKNSRPTILCFAGLDPSGGAGLQADIETIASCKAHALPIATCLTIQNTMQAYSFEAVDKQVIEKQFKALKQDVEISACKIGVIPNMEIAECISMLVQQLADTPIIYDPVLCASYGSEFSDHATIEIIKTKLLPHVTVITPNFNEINSLLGTTISNIKQASNLCDYGPQYVLATGTDQPTEKVHNSLLSDQGLIENFFYPRLAGSYHGSGCTLSSALTSYIAQEIDIQQAVIKAQDYTFNCLKNAHIIGKGQLIPTRIRQ